MTGRASEREKTATPTPRLETATVEGIAECGHGVAATDRRKVSGVSA
jgi:hypothetical protein